MFCVNSARLRCSGVSSNIRVGAAAKLLFRCDQHLRSVDSERSRLLPGSGWGPHRTAEGRKSKTEVSGRRCSASRLPRTRLPHRCSLQSLACQLALHISDLAASTGVPTWLPEGRQVSTPSRSNEHSIRSPICSPGLSQGVVPPWGLCPLPPAPLSFSTAPALGLWACPAHWLST